MPNWVSNNVEITCNCNNANEILKEVSDFLKSEENDFDFNKVVPMPESLNIEAGSEQDKAIIVYALDKMTKEYKDLSAKEKKRLKKIIFNMFNPNWVEEVIDRIKKSEYSESELQELYDKGSIYIFNYENYGHLNWYSWRIDNNNWGTKWNACEVSFNKEPGRLSYYFNTAWSMPEGVYVALSKKFPEIKITVVFTDEDMWAGNCGEIWFVNGEEEYEQIPPAGLSSFLYSISLDLGWIYDNLDFYDPDTLRDVSEHIEECGYFRDGDAKELKKAIEEYLEKKE